MGIQTKSIRWYTKLFHTAVAALLVFGVGVQNSAAQTQGSGSRLIIRDSLGLTGILNLCNLLGCSQTQALGDPNNQLFEIQTPLLLNSLTLGILPNIPLLGIVSIETDQIVATAGTTGVAAPSYLNDRTPVTFYGSTVWRGYVTQPAAQIIQADATRSHFNVTGSGITVAVIDTGVDPNHPVLKNSLVTGYDFTRNQSGGSEMNDVGLTQSTVAVLDGGNTAQVSQSTVAVLDQSTVAVLDGNGYQAFGHGTMVSGIIHLVAPQAKIMPLKSFHADGTAYNSDILRAIYYAANHGAKVVNMSFNYATYSQELANAVNYASTRGLICVAAAGNSGTNAIVYPAALKAVIDVASTSNNDTPSAFSNYGAPPVLLAAPGEGVMTTYPFGTYAAGWGTSFSAPLVTGTAALLVSGANVPVTSQTSLSLGGLSLSLSLNTSTSVPTGEPQAANAVSHAQWISAPQLGKGRLDTYQATQAWQNSLGLQ
jgi:subtilisin family serine protease